MTKRVVRHTHQESQITKEAPELPSGRFLESKSRCGNRVILADRRNDNGSL